MRRLTKNNKMAFLTGFVLAIFSVMIMAQTTRLIRNPKFKGVVSFYSGATFDFLGNALTPKTDSEDDFGSSSKRWKDVYSDSLDANFIINLAANGYMDVGSAMAGTASFTTSDLQDTVAFASAAAVNASSIFVVSANDTLSSSGIVALGWVAKADTLFVGRPSGGKSGLAYSYIRVQ